MEPIKKSRPQKWDTKVQRVSKKLSKREKIALLQSYDTQMEQGRNREEILGELAHVIGVTSQRQVERILAQAKEYKWDIKQHYAELSIEALTLASNFERYLDNLGTASGKIGNMVYGGEVHDIGSGRDFTMERIDKSVATNLLFHLREEYPELHALNEWADLTGDRITPDLIKRLRLKAYQGDFKGKCKYCPV